MNVGSNSINIGVFGGTKVGKSCIIKRFVIDTFSTKYEPTIQDYYFKTMYIDNNKYNIEIDDVSHLDETKIKFDGYIFIFSLTSLTSLKDIDAIYSKLKLNPKNLIIFCANKSDDENNIVISNNMCTQISKKYDSPVFITSAKTAYGINDAFKCIVEIVIEKRKREENIFYRLKNSCITL